MLYFYTVITYLYVLSYIVLEQNTFVMRRGLASVRYIHL